MASTMFEIRPQTSRKHNATATVLSHDQTLIHQKTELLLAFRGLVLTFSATCLVCYGSSRNSSPWLVLLLERPLWNPVIARLVNYVCHVDLPVLLKLFLANAVASRISIDSIWCHASFWSESSGRAAQLPISLTRTIAPTKPLSCLKLTWVSSAHRFP